MAIPPEIFKKIKLLEVSTRKLVNSTFAGQYHSAFKGQGMTFSDFREYVPGDDVRNISWALTARTGNTFIKKYEEERDLTLILAVDVSGSVEFGAASYYKGETMTHLAALLAFSASKNNDNVGLLLFSDQVEHYVPPKKGRGHIQRILRDLYFYKNKSKQTKISSAIDYLSGVLKKRANIFLISDFWDENSYGTALKRISKRHETIAVCISDPAELELPNVGLIDLYDPELDDWICVDTSSPLYRREFERSMAGIQEHRKAELRKARVDVVDVLNNENFVEPLAAYFKKRSR